MGDLEGKERTRHFLDIISHELLASIIGIRSNASLSQRRLTALTPEIIEVKVNDILMDCELLLLQVDQLRYALGETPFEPRPETVFVFRDVILKAINQLRPLVRERGLDTSRV